MNGMNGTRGKPEDVRIWLTCPRCYTGAVTHRSKTNDFTCKRCGAIFVADFTKAQTTLKNEGDD